MRPVQDRQGILVSVAFPPIDGVEGQLQTIRSSDFVEDPKQIVTDGVLAQMKLVRNIAVGHTFRYEVDDAFFPLCQQARCFLTNRFNRKSLAQGIDNEMKFLAARPYLPLTHCVDALAEQLRGLIAKEYAARP